MICIEEHDGRLAPRIRCDVCGGYIGHASCAIVRLTRDGLFRIMHLRTQEQLEAGQHSCDDAKGKAMALDDFLYNLCLDTNIDIAGIKTLISQVKMIAAIVDDIKV